MALRFQLILLFLICNSLLGCALGPNFHSPAAPRTKNYTATSLKINVNTPLSAQGEVQYFNQGQIITPKWWTLFHSPQLNHLIQQALENSPTLAAAQASLRQAQESFNAEVGAGLFPSITAGLSASRQASFVEQPVFTNPIFLYNLFNASVNVSYNLDFFGATRRQLEALHAQVAYQAFQLEAAQLSLAANIVTAAITEASLRAQIQASHQLILLDEKTLQIIQQQVTLGSESQVTVLAQQTQLAELRAGLPALEKNLAQLHNALAVLIGAMPSEAQLPHFSFYTVHLPTQLPLSLPSVLVKRRPDIRSAEALLHSASAEIGVATAQLFPQFSLMGSYGYTNTKSNLLFRSHSSNWSLGAQLLQPIFNGGALRAERRGAIAAFDQAAAQYKASVLFAFQNVADVLQALAFDTQTLKATVTAERAAYANWKLAQKEYELGEVYSLSLLDAERQYQQRRIASIQSQAARYVDTAALFEALGGAW